MLAPVQAAFTQPSVQILFFLVGSAVLLWLSRKPLQKKHSHGFYRFFAWECILGIVTLNLHHWAQAPFSWYQSISWVLIAASIFLVIQGVRGLKQQGQPSTQRADHELYSFERTTQLVTSGVFHYIRHPMYASLIYLAWGACFQDPHAVGAALAALATWLLWRTAKADEVECTAYFGQAYADYMARSRRFIPWVF